ncbi:MAG: VTT domain-containing protein [Clostridia bacterium]
MFRKIFQRQNRQKLLCAGGVLLFILAMGMGCVYLGKPVLAIVGHPAAFRAWVKVSGLTSRLAFVGLMALQVIVAVIPGEPFEIAAGYAFGVWEGTLLCMLGALIGSVAVFGFVRYFGLRAVHVFFPPKKVDEMKFKCLRDEKKLARLAFLLFLLPGTPKDVMTYCVGLTKMKFSSWLVICTVARIPSIITSTIGGDQLGLDNRVFAITVFALTALLSLAGLEIFRRANRRAQESVE